MAANQCIAEGIENGGTAQVASRVGINFGCLKLSDSKKRVRNGYSEGSMNVQGNNLQTSDKEYDMANTNCNENQESQNSMIMGGGSNF